MVFFKNIIIVHSKFSSYKNRKGKPGEIFENGIKDKWHVFSYDTPAESPDMPVVQKLAVSLATRQ